MSYKSIDFEVGGENDLNTNKKKIRFEINCDYYGLSESKWNIIDSLGNNVFPKDKVFDKSNDKLTLVLVGATSNITTQEFDAIKDVEVTSDGISGTQIFFAPDSDLESGRLTLPDVEESFSDTWTATTYTVEIIADVNLV